MALWLKKWSLSFTGFGLKRNPRTKKTGENPKKQKNTTHSEDGSSNRWSFWHNSSEAHWWLWYAMGCFVGTLLWPEMLGCPLGPLEFVDCKLGNVDLKQSIKNHPFSSNKKSEFHFNFVGGHHWMESNKSANVWLSKCRLDQVSNLRNPWPPLNSEVYPNGKENITSWWWVVVLEDLSWLLQCMHDWQRTGGWKGAKKPRLLNCNFLLLNCEKSCSHVIALFNCFLF